MTENTDATEPTQPKRTDATTRETHLDRMLDLERWLENMAAGTVQCIRTGEEIKQLYLWSYTLRWLIERERAEPPWKAATEKAFAHLTTLEANWDTYGGVPIDPEHIGAARFVLEQIMANDSPPPQVTPTSNGSVQLEWSRNGIDLEIEICDADVPGHRHVHYCHTLSGTDEETVYSLEDIDALRGTISAMRARS